MGTAPGPAAGRPAVTARVRQLAAHAEHRRAIAEFHTRRDNHQQDRIDALLPEDIARARQPPRRTRPHGNRPA